MNRIGPVLGKRIREFREREAVSQEKLAKLIGVSRPALSQIENGERKVSADELVALAGIFNVSVERLLDLEKPVEVSISEQKEEREAVQEVRIHVPQKNVRKFKEILLYILTKVGARPNIGETVIYKLLYFIDFDYYELHEEQLIGATYMKNNHGPTPVEFKKIVERMIQEGEIEKVRSEYFSYPQTKYLPRRSPKLEILSADELQLIDHVLERLVGMNANQISNYSHDDVPWKTTARGKVIPYESVFYRTAPYSMRNYEE